MTTGEMDKVAFTFPEFLSGRATKKAAKRAADAAGSAKDIVEKNIVNKTNEAREYIQEAKERFGLGKLTDKDGFSPLDEEEITRDNVHRKVGDIREEAKKLRDVAKRSGERSRLGLLMGTAGVGGSGMVGYHLGHRSANNQMYNRASLDHEELEVLARELSDEITDELIKEAMTPEQRETVFTKEFMIGNSLSVNDMDSLAAEIVDEIIKEASFIQNLSHHIQTGLKDFGVIAAADLASIAAAKRIWGGPAKTGVKRVSSIDPSGVLSAPTPTAMPTAIAIQVPVPVPIPVQVPVPLPVSMPMNGSWKGHIPKSFAIN